MKNRAEVKASGRTEREVFEKAMKQLEAFVGEEAVWAIVAAEYTPMYLVSGVVATWIGEFTAEWE